MTPQYIAPAVTALNADQEIDAKGSFALYDFLLRHKISGIVLMGSTGEFFGLSMRQARELIDLAVPYLKGKTRVFAGTGRMNFRECVELSQYAAQKGADGVMLVSPYYFPFQEDAVFDYYSAIASEVRCPIYLYNYPDRTGYSITPQTVLKLVEKHPHIIGFKDTVPDMHHTSEIIRAVKPRFPEFEVFSGFDNNFAHNVMSGGNGCIGALSNLAPELCMHWVASFAENDFDGIRAMQKTIDSLMPVYALASPFIPLLKRAVALRGIAISDYCTSPMSGATERQCADIQAFLRQNALGTIA